MLKNKYLFLKAKSRVNHNDPWCNRPSQIRRVCAADLPIVSANKTLLFSTKYTEMSFSSVLLNNSNITVTKQQLNVHLKRGNGARIYRFKTPKVDLRLDHYDR